MPVTIINSNYKITDINSHFKISAGPGAGKTYWLVNHLKNILHNSDKLSITRKVACITYTNIAVETIIGRIGNSSTHAEISTIHSFLYKHIVKPYVAFIAEDYGLDVSKMDGHDDMILSNYSFLNDWKDRTNQRHIRDDQTVINAFKKLQWKVENNDLVVRTSYPFRVGKYLIKNDSYFEYKKMTWGKGLVHHDDVLFFSFHIIKKFPFVINVLYSKFPYLIVDEFQDSNPIQIEILKKLGQGGIYIGVIGDYAQSIYGFQGADYSQFNYFSLPDIKYYILNENRRSSNEIIDLLNYLRRDITQVKFLNFSTEKPKIFIGDMVLALKKAKKLCGDESVNTLSRDNITSNAMKAEINGIGLNSKLLEELVVTDKPSSNNKYRSKVIISCIKAIAYARENKFSDAMKELIKLLNYKTDKIEGKKKALEYLTILLKNFEDYKDASLLEFSEFVKKHIDSNITKVTRGEVKVFYEKYSFKQLSMCVSIPEDLSLHKTIHKAKGDEFNNVLLILNEEKDSEFLINTDLLNNEEQRINYVAISRAKNRLFISVPTFAVSKYNKINNYFDIENI